MSALLGQPILKLLALLALGLELGVRVLFVAVEAGSLLFHVSLVLLTIDLASLFVALDGSLNLQLEIRGFLLDKVDLLVLQGPLSFVVDLLLGVIVFPLLELLLNIRKLLCKLILFSKELLFEGRDGLFLLNDSVLQSILLVLKGGDSALFTGCLLRHPLNFFHKFLALSIELTLHLINLILVK